MDKSNYEWNREDDSDETHDWRWTGYPNVIEEEDDQNG